MLFNHQEALSPSRLEGPPKWNVRFSNVKRAALIFPGAPSRLSFNRWFPTLLPDIFVATVGAKRLASTPANSAISYSSAPQFDRFKAQNHLGTRAPGRMVNGAPGTMLALKHPLKMSADLQKIGKRSGLRPPRPRWRDTGARFGFGKIEESGASKHGCVGEQFSR